MTLFPFQVKRNSVIKSDHTNSTVEKLLSNRFACQVWLTDSLSVSPNILMKKKSSQFVTFSYKLTVLCLSIASGEYAKDKTNPHKL